MPLISLSEMASPAPPIKCQVCIVGAGLAGYALAMRLAEKGVHVVVLESGGVSRDKGAFVELNKIERPHGHYSRAETNRARGIGGTSSIWGGRLLPIDRFHTQPRPFLDEPGWPFEIQKLDQYARDVESMFGLAPGGYEEEPYPGDGGPSLAADRASVTARWAKTPSFTKRNIEKLWLRLARRPNLELIYGATATLLDVDPSTGRLRSITARSLDGKKIQVQPDHGILATGTIEVTRLLLWTRAGLGQNRFGGRSLGRYFQDHLRLEAGYIQSGTNRMLSRFNYAFVENTLRSIYLELSPDSQHQNRVYGAFAYTQLDLARTGLGHLRETARDLQRGRVNFRHLARLAASSPMVAQSLYGMVRTGFLATPKSARLNVLMGVEQQPQYDNRIEMACETDPLGIPLARIVWKPSEIDGRAFTAMARGVAGFWKQAGLPATSLHWNDIWSKPALEIALSARDAAHPSGTTRMGVARHSSVVSSNLTCHDCPNLSVVSAATFPTAGSANPTMTLLKLALFHADYLKASGAC